MGGKLLALDPATRVGWATTPDDVMRIQCGSWQAPRGSDYTIADKAAALARELDAFLTFEVIDYALVETPISAPPRPKQRVVKTKIGFDVEEDSTGSLHTQNMLWAIHGAMIAALAIHSVPTRLVAAPTWRAAMLPSGGRTAGNVSKRLCKQILSERFNVKVPNVDAAEAGMILLFLERRVQRWRLEDKAVGNENHKRRERHAA